MEVLHAKRGSKAAALLLIKPGKMGCCAATQFQLCKKYVLYFMSSTYKLHVGSGN